ncbi:class II glutamine amidotransferase [Parafrankia sp. EUN1f]|uniref:class II glutamine amidotransferase n=1 Tax=Parafrankia sp. EUN1f TaxID=102897 RepID=UPI0001C44E1F|nr:class II glutamine amidotransferase [Parafrankia sp. EUN1f]EFC84082.1 glutamine amidotransferase, class-II [Parafrankia sp. EUN1f]
MCHLFAMSGGAERIEATFWLLDAPDNPRTQTRRPPDGAGLGVFAEDGTPQVSRQAIRSRADTAFAREAQQVTSTTFVAHVRHASTGRVDDANTHPFLQDGRIFAHNGVVEGLDKLDAELGPARAGVVGNTDSERYFALVTREIAARDGDVGEGITAAVNWIAENLPLYSINMVLATPRELWALRYPDTNGLHVLQRAPGGRNQRHLDHASPFSEIRVRSVDLRTRPAVVVESERMDEDPRWRLMASGELLHVAPDLSVTSRLVLAGPPSHALDLDDLRPEAAASQTAAVPDIQIPA